MNLKIYIPACTGSQAHQVAIGSSSDKRPWISHATHPSPTSIKNCSASGYAASRLAVLTTIVASYVKLAET